jgi:hypothetical protein
MNDTPRTDAIAHRGYNESAYISEMTGLSRQLERENKTFRAAQKACEDCDAPRVDRIAELERELAESTESLAFQTQLNREVIELEKKTFAELAAERALADRLAGEIEKASPARLLFPWENEQSPSVDATEKPMP